MKAIFKILFVLTILTEGTLQAKEGNTNIDFYSEVTSDTHPAAPYILAWLDAQVQKDYQAFAASFDTQSNYPFLVILPGGNILRDPKDLLLRHEKFYENPAFTVVREDLRDGMGNEDFFTCSVLVHVTLPGGAMRTNYIDMTFLRNADLEPKWGPSRIINTVVNSLK